MVQIDHEQRRHRITEATFDVIAAEGLDAATIRRIAAQLGVSTAAITHYFATKQELLVWTYRALGEKAHARLRAAAARTDGDVVECLLATAAIDEPSIRHWRVYLAFWERAARDPAFRDHQGENMRWSLGEIGALLTKRCPALPEAEESARLLAALVQGISIQVLLDEASWPAARVRGVLEDQVRRLAG